MAWYLTDEAGSAHEIVDSNGTILDRLTYSPFGEFLSETNPANGDRFKYAGGAYDAITGLTQFGLRYYDPAQGRWPSEDPGGYAMGDSKLYRYVGNNPMNATDPTGLKFQATGPNGELPPPPAAGGGSSAPPSDSSDPNSPYWWGSGFNPCNWPGMAVGFAADNIVGNRHELRDIGALPRSLGALRLAGGAGQAALAGSLLAAPEPTVTKLAGAALLVWVAYDNMYSGAKDVVTGETSDSLTVAKAAEVVQSFGVDEQTALEKARLFDLWLNVASGAFRPGPSSAGRALQASGTVAPNSNGFGESGRIGSVPTGGESRILKNLYLKQVDSTMFKFKLSIHNSIKRATTLGQSKWVTPSEIKSILESKTTFRSGASTVHLVGDGFVIGGSESMGYLNRTITHHEMMHIGQYIRNPNIIDTRPFGYIHEVIPSFIGTPEIYGSGTIVVGGMAYWYLSEKK